MGQKKCQKVLPDSKVRNRGVQQPPPPSYKDFRNTFSIDVIPKEYLFKGELGIKNTNAERKCNFKVG